jgi:hypothetical protein
MARRAVALNPKSLQVQGAFLASVVANAQCDRYVEVVTSPRGFRKSACVTAMASKSLVMQEIFATKSPFVKMAGSNLPVITSGFELFETLLEDLSEFEPEDFKEMTSKVRQVGAAVKVLSKNLPILNTTLENASVKVKRPILVLCDDVLGGLLTRE